MSYFVCLVRPSGAPITDVDRDRASADIRSKGLRLERWMVDRCFCATAVGTPLSSSPSTATIGSLSVVGTVRLDNREELASRRPGQHDGSDLEIVGATLRDEGRQSIARLVGDFAFASWDSRDRTFIAARDPLGVRHLFWAMIEPDLLALASHASLLVRTDAYSCEYVAQSLASAHRRELTIYEGVKPVPAGAAMRIENGRVVIDRYWSPENAPVGDGRLRPEHCDEFRDLFEKAVRARLPRNGCVWAELSGGLDTSSVVMTADQFHRRAAVPTNLAGTVTYADRLGGGDESEYVRAVLVATGLPNNELMGHWPWEDDGSSPPATEFPGPVTLFWARERRRDELLKEAGADVLLSGAGGDYILDGNALYFADWVARGHFLTACRDLLRLSALSGESFWKSALANAVAPLLPTMLRSHFVTTDDWIIPSWVNSAFRRKYEMNRLATSQRVHGLTGAAGSKYHQAFVNRVRTIEQASACSHPSVDYERRYPFLYKPLVEFALRLPPPDGVVRPLAGKWILREAMRGVLPELVRTRVTKGSAGSRMLWSLEHERKLIEWMLKDPILAQMGCVDAAPLREAYTQARLGRMSLIAGLFKALALETWLRIRSGRWPVRSAASRSASWSSSTLNIQGVL